MTITPEQTVALSRQDREHHIHPVSIPAKRQADDSSLITHAEGIYLYTGDGKKIIDAASGLSCVNVGYGNQRICDAASNAMRQLSFAHTVGNRTHPWVAKLSAKLAAITPENFQQFFFSMGGSDANESALKIAWHYWSVRSQPSKQHVIARHESYHGNTITMAGVTGFEKFNQPFGLPINPLVHHIDQPCWRRYGGSSTQADFGIEAAALLEQKILELGADNVAAFIGEPIVAAADLIIPPENYWPEIRRICDRHNVLLIADEVITGFGKSGTLFAFEQFGYEPDLIVMAKGLSSGYFPIAAVGIGEKIGHFFQHSEQLFAHLFTHCGHPVGAAVALENIAVIEEYNLVEKVKNDIGPYFSERLQELSTYPCVKSIRALGVFASIDIDPDVIVNVDQFQNALSDLAWEKGLAMRPSGFVLPMVISHQEIDQIIDILKSVFSELSKKEEVGIASQK